MVCLCGAGVTRRAFLSRAAMTASALPLAGCDAAVPDWLADLLVPEEMEAELGLRAFQKILQETPPVRDPPLQGRLAAIGERIVGASSSPYPDWRFVVLESPQVNAFALPGGYVGVYTGMLRAAAGEAQLATVLGHEVAHVNARHGAQRLVAENSVALLLRIGASLLAWSDTPVSPDVIVALGGAAAEFGLIRPFSRSQELQADELGLRYMAAAGYDPVEAVAFWRRMAALNKDNGRVPAFLATHPSDAHRIEELEALLPALHGRA